MHTGSVLLKAFIFFYYSSIGLFLPYLPLLLSQNGLGSWQIGILFSLGPLVIITTQPFWGFISDRLKTVKKLIVFQLGATALLSLLVFRLDSFELLMPALFLFNFFAFPIIPLTDSLTLSLASKRGGHYGGFRLWGSLGFGLSAVFFGIFFRTHSLELFPAGYFALIVVCAALSLFLTDSVHLGRRAVPGDVKTLVTDPRIMAFLLLTAVLSSSNRANDSFLGIFISQLGGSTEIVGYAWAVAVLSEVPVLAAGGYLLSRYSELKLLAVSAAVFAVRWALFGLVTDPVLIVLIQMSHSVSFGLFFLCSVSYMSKLVPERLRSSGLGLLSAFLGGLGGIAGSTIGGLLMNGYGPGVMYPACSLAALASFFVYLLWVKKPPGGRLESKTQ